MPPTFPPPSPGIIRVWLARMDAPPVPLDDLRAALAPDESARMARFALPAGRARYAVGRGLLRRALGEALGVAPAAVPLVEGVNGRPVLARGATAPAVAFNVSHSHDLLAIAVARLPAGADALPLGVDVERLRDVMHMDGVARRVFDDAERAAIAGEAEGTARLRVFHRLWTRKEACMKATGAGFALPPHTFHVDPVAPVQRVALPAHAQAPAGLVVTVHDLAAGPDAAGAVAVAGEGWTVEARAPG